MSPSPDLTRRVLVPIHGALPAVAQAARVRRYRLARLPLHAHPDRPLERFTHQPSS